MTGHGGGEGAKSQGGADRSNDRGVIQVSEAGAGNRGSSRLGRAGDWKARGGSERHGAN